MESDYDDEEIEIYKPHKCHCGMIEREHCSSGGARRSRRSRRSLGGYSLGGRSSQRSLQSRRSQRSMHGGYTLGGRSSRRSRKSLRGGVLPLSLRPYRLFKDYVKCDLLYEYKQDIKVPTKEMSRLYKRFKKNMQKLENF